MLQSGKTFLVCATYAVFSISSLLSTLPVYHHAITARIVGDGRLGDGIYTYCLAKWFSYRYNIPLYFTPFQHSDVFSFENVEKFIDKNIESRFAHVIDILSEDELIDALKNAQVPTLFTLGFGVKIYAPPSLTESIMWPDCYSNVYAILREHDTLFTEIKKALTLKIGVPKPSLPLDKISVAVHVRKGSGPDRGQACVQYLDEWERVLRLGIREPVMKRGHDCSLPLKFPPEQFYVDQIKKLSTLLNNAPMYIYIFTDDKNPGDLATRFKKRLDLPNITFAYREGDAQDNHQNKNVIFEELFSMSQFDCVIRAESGLSWATQLIGNPKVIIHPQCSEIQFEESLNQTFLTIWETTIIFNNPESNSARHYSFRNVTQDHVRNLDPLLPSFRCYKGL